MSLLANESQAAIRDEIFEVRGGPTQVRQWFIALRDYLQLKQTIGNADDAKDAKRRAAVIRHLTATPQLRGAYRSVGRVAADKRVADEMRFLVVLRPR